MKILIVGSGGREHALAWRFASIPGTQLYAMPGNPGMARIAQCLPAQTLSPQIILGAAETFAVDLTVVGPEAPLVAGVVDLFRAARLPIVGPTAEAARLEGSKVFAKRFFEQHRIPTARFATASTAAEAAEALSRFTFPLVIKADGLSGGKGVIIARTREEADLAIENLGPDLVIEEFLEGKEISFMVLSDGRSLVPLIPSRDHKRVLDGDLGPNTGGMGAYCDAGLLTDAEADDVLERIISPTVEATAFTGFLYAGLIMTPKGPKLLEYNVRLGDPEAQALMHHLEDDFAEVLLSSARQSLAPSPLKWRPGVSHSVVAAAAGYPGSYRSGDSIFGIDRAESRGAVVFHAGTRVGWSGYATAGGRVLSVTTSGANLEEAAQKTYRCLREIHFDGMHYRRDIGCVPERLS